LLPFFVISRKPIGFVQLAVLEIVFERQFPGSVLRWMPQNLLVTLLGGLQLNGRQDT
jgi:hypothetical protein